MPESRDVSVGVRGVGLGSIAGGSNGDSSIPLVKRNSQTILNVAFAGSDEGGRYDPADRSDVLGHARAQPRNAGAGAAQERSRKCAVTTYPRG